MRRRRFACRRRQAHVTPLFVAYFSFEMAQHAPKLGINLVLAMSNGLGETRTSTHYLLDIQDHDLESTTWWQLAVYSVNQVKSALQKVNSLHKSGSVSG